MSRKRSDHGEEEMDYDFEDDMPYVVIEKKSAGVGPFLVGAAIGAAVALLMAPQSGIETRRRIRRTARQARDTVEDTVEGAVDRVTGTFHDARRRVEERIDAARQAVDLKKRQVTRAMEAGRMAAQQAREDLELRLAETKAAYEAGADVARDARSTRSVAAPGEASLTTGLGTPEE